MANMVDCIGRDAKMKLGTVAMMESAWPGVEMAAWTFSFKDAWTDRTYMLGVF